MAITDELHGLNAKIRPYLAPEAVLALRSELNAIADRIDAEHERMWRELTTDAEPMTDESMAEHGWYRVLDGDKVPVRIGDEVDSDLYEDGTVMGVQFYGIDNGSIRTLIAVRPERWDVATWRTPDEYRHHHAPTVEDVLREFAGRVCNSGHQWGLDAADTIAEFAAKLRLAEEVDE